MRHGLGRLLVAVLAASLAPACSDDVEDAPPWDPAAAEAAAPGVAEALSARDPQRALAELQRLQEQGALPDGALHLKALALADVGRTEEALRTWREELAAHPGNGRGRALLAQLLLDQGALDEAAEQLALARRFAGADPVVALISGRAALMRDDDEAARRCYRDYLSSDPYSVQAAEAHHALAQIAARRGATDEAAAHEETSRALNRVHGYLSSFQRRLRDDPTDLEAAYGVVTAFNDLYVNMGRDPRLREQAEQAVQYVLKRRPDDARALYNLGFIRTEERRWSEARDLFLAALRSDPDYAPARLNLGLVEVRVGDRAAGIAELERVATAGSPEDAARARFELVNVLEAGTEGERVRAVEHCRALIEAFPDDRLGMRPRLARLLGAGEGAPAPEPAEPVPAPATEAPAPR